MTEQEYIKKAMLDYKEKVSAHKSHPLQLSNYRVEKPWGYEIWLVVNEFYAYKLIHMNTGCQCSLQSHDFKIEANYVIEGKAKVLLENDMGVMEEFIFGPGQGWEVPLKRKHRVISLEAYTALEVSTAHLDDVIRYNDDYNRQNGKIDSEHPV